MIFDPPFPFLQLLGQLSIFPTWVSKCKYVVPTVIPKSNQSNPSRGLTLNACVGAHPSSCFRWNLHFEARQRMGVWFSLGSSTCLWSAGVWAEPLDPMKSSWRWTSRWTQPEICLRIKKEILDSKCAKLCNQFKMFLINAFQHVVRSREREWWEWTTNWPWGSWSWEGGW